MGLQNPYGSDSVSDYNDNTGSGGGSENSGSYEHQTATQAYNVPGPYTSATPYYTNSLNQNVNDLEGPLTQSGSYYPEDMYNPEQGAMDYYYNQMQNNPDTPGASDWFKAITGMLTANPTGAIDLIGDYISTSNQSTEQTIQHFIDQGMDPEQAKNVVDYAQSQAGPGFEYTGGGGDHDQALLAPNNVAGGGSTNPSDYGTMEDYIRAIGPQATEILQGGTASAVDREQAALNESLGLLSPYGGTEAWNEIAALTGASGQEAQQAAISGIPQTEAQLAAQDRERRQQMRQASAMGRAGGGATVSEMIDLGGRQQAETVANRIQQLQPISDINRQTASVMSGMEEGSLTRMSQIEQQYGPQAAAILQGMVGPITETRTTASELSGLQDVNQASQNAQLMEQLANIMGQYGSNN